MARVLIDGQIMTDLAAYFMNELLTLLLQNIKISDQIQKMVYGIFGDTFTA